jgi:hypothetical protein
MYFVTYGTQGYVHKFGDSNDHSVQKFCVGQMSRIGVIDEFKVCTGVKYYYTL